MYRKAYCPKHSDFNHYYSNQSGSGFGDISVVRAPRYQRGYGLGSFFGRLAMPILKYLGKEALNKGVTLGKRVVQDPQIQQAFKEGVADLATKSINKIQQKLGPQRGSGRRRLYKKKRTRKARKPLRKVKKRSQKRVSKKKKSIKRRRDIFKS